MEDKKLIRRRFEVETNYDPELREWKWHPDPDYSTEYLTEEEAIRQSLNLLENLKQTLIRDVAVRVIEVETTIRVIGSVQHSKIGD